ncbi:hypothetical protein J6E39_05555 [bacterium]|nr:hypothetical protein [bacterium]
MVSPDNAHQKRGFFADLMKNKVSLVILLLCLCAYFNEKPYDYRLICNNNVCEIQHNAVLGMITLKKRVDIKNITCFEYEYKFDWIGYFLHATSRHTGLTNKNRYKKFAIVAKTKNGKVQTFFKPVLHNQKDAEATVTTLNEALAAEYVNVDIEY